MRLFAALLAAALPAAAKAAPGNPDALAGSPEGLHPDRAGYRAVAKALAGCLDARLKAKAVSKTAR